MLDLSNMDKLTLITLWAFSFVCLALIVIRLGWRYKRGESFFPDDFWMAFSVAPLVLRVAFIHMTMVFGTSIFNHQTIPESFMSQQEMDERILGSKLVLPGRICYTAFIWCMKIACLNFLERLSQRAKPYGRLIDITYGIMAVSFIAICLSTFLECRPFNIYYQLYPDPGSCVQARGQLLTMGSLNILTDVILILIPIPIIFNSRLPVPRKIQFFILFGISTILIAITVVRMPIIIGKHDMQQFRSFWANVECLAACVVANAPTFHRLLRPHYHHHHDAEHGAAASPNDRQPRCMPVTGVNSRGSITRGDMMESARGTRSILFSRVTDSQQKMSVLQSRTMRAPWRGDFLGTSIWTPNEFVQMPPKAKKKIAKKQPRIESEPFYPGVHDPRRPGDTVPLSRLPELIFD